MLNNTLAWWTRRACYGRSDRSNQPSDQANHVFDVLFLTKAFWNHIMLATLGFHKVCTRC